MATVRLCNVSKIFGVVEIIKGISLEIADREFAVFVGPSGCGKSTLLRLIAGLEDLTSGEVFIDGERMNDAPPFTRGLAMVFQSYALYPHMTVAENMAFSLKLAGVTRSEREQRVREASSILRIESLLDRKPRELSGGQRQRVAIGRAIIRKPRVFLFDEPLSNLDAALRVQMRFEIMRLHEELKTTMIYVTHDQIEAMTMADRIVVMQGGAVEQTGTPLELYHRPSNRFVAGFIGSPRMNFFKVTVDSLGAEEVAVILPGGDVIRVPIRPGNLQPGTQVSLGIRPEHLLLAEAGLLRGEVLVVEHLGSTTLLHVRIHESQIITLQAGGESSARIHDIVRISMPPRACHLFDEQGMALAHAW